MFRSNHLLLTAALFVLNAAVAQPLLAGNACCQSCGCDSHVKKVCRLVVTCDEVELPTYGCVPTNVFHPDKGAVCHTQYRCDTFCTLHKTCGCTIDCCCETQCGCKTLYGAKPTGCHTTDCVPQPTGTCTSTVPVLKWVTIYVCDDCCRSKTCRQ